MTLRCDPILRELFSQWCWMSFGRRTRSRPMSWRWTSMNLFELIVRNFFGMSSVTNWRWMPCFPTSIFLPKSHKTNICCCSTGFLLYLVISWKPIQINILNFTLMNSWKVCAGLRKNICIYDMIKCRGYSRMKVTECERDDLKWRLRQRK